MSQIRESLQRDLAEVCWRDLRIHLQRDAVIIVAPEIDIIDAGVAVAGDDKFLVERWVSAGQVAKPSKEQLESWENELDKPFRMLIVQPFILIQSAEHA
ncbi:MAG: DUF2288 domain-containing protein [Desulfuromonas sp.]|nr:MAG: DUF2288 domain-containing protein [Desulfuromonas sp.]